jgi:hypothetical protein
MFGDAAVCPNGPGQINQLRQPVVAGADTPSASGMWQAAADGGVFTCGSATFFGSAGSLHLNRPIVGMAATSDGDGYWLVASDGGIFSYGDASYFGSMGGQSLNAPIVGMAPTPDGKGYWLVASDGGVFSFGDASYFGSMGGQSLNAPIVAIAVNHDDGGYWLAGADGGVFAFGDATFFGSEAGVPLNAPVTSMAATPDSQGYWLAGADGGVFTFGDAGYFGSLAVPSCSPGGSEGGTTVANPGIGIMPTPDGRGYVLLFAPPAVDALQPGYSGYTLAQREWLVFGTICSAAQNSVLEQAVWYLQVGTAVDPGDTSGYAAAMTDMEQIQSVPEMGASPGQIAMLCADIPAVDRFFGLSPLYGACIG